jgi:TetR/AcrR family tetracycline transcriptional repressor
MALTRDEIVTTAIRLLDKVGLQGLTLRRLARELGISAPTLYWHVRDKRELLDLMAERMIVEFRAKQPPLPKGLAWSDKVAELCRRQYFALIAHRDGAQVVAGNRPTGQMLSMADRWLGIWIDAGFAPDEALTLILSVGNYIIGSALEYQAEADRAKVRQDVVSASRVDKSCYPNLQKAIEARFSRPFEPHTTFEYGLRLLVAGIQAHRAALDEKDDGAGAPSAEKPSGKIRKRQGLADS